MVDCTTWAVLVGLFVVAAVVAIREQRHSARIQKGMQHIDTLDDWLECLYADGLRFRIIELNAHRSRWEPFAVAVSPTRLVIYTIGQDVVPRATILPDQLRWFGRPKKYSSGANEIWLHFEHDNRWWLLQLHLYRLPMQALVRALKEIATPDQVTAYRRRRPYIHYGPVVARPATQDIHGAWTLGDPLHLYLMPAYLVWLDGASVRQTVALETVQKVSAFKRLDQPGAAGLVRFEAGGTPLAFALEKYEAFAEALAEAAKRTLEDPVQWQRKKKKSDDYDWD